MTSSELAVDSPDREPIYDVDEAPSPRNFEQPRHGGRHLIEQFASVSGFIDTRGNNFHRSDGCRLIRAQGTVFQWQLWTANGRLLQSYWLRNHCIDREPLELPAEVWGWCERSPDHYSLVLVNKEGVPVEISGRRLVLMRENEELTIYPATYRLAFKGIQRTGDRTKSSKGSLPSSGGLHGRVV